MSYSAFAAYYDILTANVNYAGYARRVDRLLSDFGLQGCTVLDAACGTASLSAKLSELGYGIIGADISREMISFACDKLGSERPKGRFKLSVGDIRRLSPSEFSADAAVCSLDALNHLGGIGEVEAAFRSIAGCLGKGGVFIFDMNTPYKHRAVLGENTFVYDLPEVYAVWQNRFRESDCSVGITLDLFGKTESGYQRHTERFREKAYPKSAVLDALRRAGFRSEAVFDELKSCAPGPRTERILYVARRI